MFSTPRRALLLPGWQSTHVAAAPAVVLEAAFDLAPEGPHLICPILRLKILEHPPPLDLGHGRGREGEVRQRGETLSLPKMNLRISSAAWLDLSTGSSC